MGLIMNMLNRKLYSAAVISTVGICLVLVSVQQFQLMSFIKQAKSHYTSSSSEAGLLFTTPTATTVIPDADDPTTAAAVSNVFDDSVVLPGPYNLLEDSLQHSNALLRPTKECTLEFMNYNRLQQDHPCVINYIRRHYLKGPPPSGPNVSRNLDYPEVEDPSDGQPKTILNLLNNQTNGFFIECGALDGENLSNTLYMERFFNWSGILIEADQDSFENLISRKRNTWSLPVCLSVKPYPTHVTFRINYALSQIVDMGFPVKNLTGKTSSKGRDVIVQCFPLYSILLAVGRTQIDFFSLDVEGHELLVLKTIPFDKVDIKTLTVEWTGGEMMANKGLGKDSIQSFMEAQGYETVSPIQESTSDLFFMLKNE